MPPRVLLMYTPKELTPNNENVSERVLQDIRDALDGIYDVVTAEFDPREIRATLSYWSPQLIFNLAYGYTMREAQTSLRQPEVAAILESSRIPMIGSSAAVQLLVQDKLVTGWLLRQMGMRAPRDLAELGCLDPKAQVVVKPRFGACHQGVHLISKGSFEARTDDVMCQEYLPGREFSVGVIEESGDITAMRPVEIKGDRDPIFLGLADFQHAYRAADDYVDVLTKKSIDAFRNLGLRDYARFDIRMADDEPVFLDVNALPNLDREVSLLPYAAKISGVSFGQLIRTITQNAAHRNGVVQ